MTITRPHHWDITSCKLVSADKRIFCKRPKSLYIILCVNSKITQRMSKSPYLNSSLAIMWVRHKISQVWNQLYETFNYFWLAHFSLLTELYMVPPPPKPIEFSIAESLNLCCSILSTCKIWNSNFAAQFLKFSCLFRRRMLKQPSLNYLVL